MAKSLMLTTAPTKLQSASVFGASVSHSLIDLVGISERDVLEAIRNAIYRAGQTVRGLDWFEGQELRGTIRDGEVAQFQVTVKVGFRVLSPEDLHASFSG